MQNINSFSIRVYGFITNEHGQILLSNEAFKNQVFTKFPGGGLHFGESTLEALKRELSEELNIVPTFGRHIYTCDFLVQNQFDFSKQVIGIYYSVNILKDDQQLIDNTINETKVQGELKLLNREWCTPIKLESRLTFPMDIKAAQSYLDFIST